MAFWMAAAANAALPNGGVWPDSSGVHVNAHGGGIVREGDKWYWFGEHKVAGEAGNFAQVGVRCSSSGDLVNWKDEGIALAVSDEVGSPIERGCILERPKVLKCAATGKFVMYFHLELKGNGYESAETGIAQADTITGPYSLVWHGRPLGEMSRDMSLFLDDDGTAYHVFSTNSNRDERIVRLAPDFLSHTTNTCVLGQGHYTEAPCIVKRGGWYYLLGSGCSGWAPNEARYYRAPNIMGPWERVGNPCQGVNPQNRLGPKKTWGAQSAHIFEGADGTQYALFDIWRPKDAIDGRYVILPIDFDNENHTMSITWQDEFNGER